MLKNVSINFNGSDQDFLKVNVVVQYGDETIDFFPIDRLYHLFRNEPNLILAEYISSLIKEQLKNKEIYPFSSYRVSNMINYDNLEEKCYDKFPEFYI